MRSWRNRGISPFSVGTLTVGLWAVVNNAGTVGSIVPVEWLTNFTVIYITNFYAFFHSISLHLRLIVLG